MINLASVFRIRNYLLWIRKFLDQYGSNIGTEINIIANEDF